jgi:hypothetical protein
MRRLAIALLGVAGAFASSPSLVGALTTPATTYTATGTAPVAAAISALESAIGGSDNGTTQGPLTGGLRTVNWDTDFIGPTNNDQLPQSVYADPRGVHIETPSGRVEVSRSGLADIDPTYPLDFPAYSPPAIFTPLGSTETDLTFEVPTAHAIPVTAGSGPGDPATIGGFGVVFLNVEQPGTSQVQLFASDGTSLGTYDAPTGSHGSPEFVGVLLQGSPIASVRIISGTAVLAPGTVDGPQSNVVALDNLIFTEPTSIYPAASGAPIPVVPPPPTPTPPPAATPAPTPPLPQCTLGGASPSVAFARGRRGTTAALDLTARCTAAATLTLTARVILSSEPRRTYTLRNRPFAITAGEPSAIIVSLPPRPSALLRRHRHLQASTTIMLSARNATGTSVTSVTFPDLRR